MNPSKVHDVHTRLGLYERGAMSAPFGYTGINGVYKGMTGTDESALAYGEFWLIIEDGMIAMLVATGREIQRGVTKRSDWHPLSDAKVASWFNDGADIDGVTGMAYGESGIEVLFLRQELAPEAPNVLVLGMFGYETFGPGRLFNPRAVSSGLHHQMIQSIQHDLELPNAFPQIAFGGRAPREL